MVKKALTIVGVMLVIYLAYFLFRGVSFYKYIAKGGEKNTPAPVEKMQYNILLMGYGGEGHDGPYLTDSIMIAHLDLKTNKVALISLPRDLWVGLPTKSGEDFHSKINAVYQIGLFPSTFPDVNVKKAGSTDVLKASIKTITGLTIDNIVTVDFAGFEKAVDALGGIDVQVQKTFDDYEYPIDGQEKNDCGKVDQALDDALKLATSAAIGVAPTAFPCRFEHLHFDAGKVHMDGATALKYVRSRHSLQDGSDFGRAARQQQFVKAVKEKLLNVSILANVFPLMDQLKDHISVDVSSDELKKFIAEAKDIVSYKIITIRMSDTDYLKSSYSDYGGYILIPRSGEDNWTEIHTMIQNGINEIKPTATPTPVPTGKITPTVKK